MIDADGIKDTICAAGKFAGEMAGKSAGSIARAMIDIDMPDDLPEMVKTNSDIMSQLGYYIVIGYQLDVPEFSAGAVAALFALGYETGRAKYADGSGADYDQLT